MPTVYGPLNSPLAKSLKTIWPDFQHKNIRHTRVVVPRQQAWSIYTIRYNVKLSKAAFSDQPGYEKALAELNSFKEELVAIHTFTDIKELVIVFSDVTDTLIIGSFLW
ncbi:hypothetical protein HB364_26910 [Pseudoflavitalea sp. X16]|uniref:hypothetical protein n=1 Tax=Paraflavitalea devenefica TaxID=2716334 RepID=UPI001423C7D2|nr:hypothetical protein [Paraflavitalea devenefica]NII28741.1 hypothetical protein [Paraflavitalea devenefica]